MQERRAYPRPRVPILPLLSWGAFSAMGRAHAPSVLDAGEALAVTSGSAAIALALKHADVGPADKVLLPAFHCSSMVEPVLAVGAGPEFYKLQADLSVELDDVRARVKQDEGVRAILVPHYFGFPQNLPAIRELCDAHELILIEDCAHSFFGTCAGRPLGSYGDYAIASVRKFFPTHDGGLLISSRRSIANVPLEPGGLAFHMRAASNILEEAAEYRRMRSLYFFLALPLYLRNRMWKRLRATPESSVSDPDSPDTDSLGTRRATYRYLDPALIYRKMSFPSRAVVKLAAKHKITTARRANYRRLVETLSGLPTGRPLAPDLPPDVVPYMFPFLIDDPEGVFPTLKNHGVPIWRWDDIEVKHCSTSVDYSVRLLQLPCHQELRTDELDWMATCIKSTLNR